MTKVLDLIQQKGRNVQTIPTTTSIADAAQAFLDAGVSSFLVSDGDTVVGIFTKNDLVRRCVAEPEGFDTGLVGECMTTDLITASPGDDLNEVLDDMIRRGLRHMPVVDDGRAVGMITPVDILLYQNHLVRFENDELVRYIHGGY
jgi:CBS domain-containing protein